MTTQPEQIPQRGTKDFTKYAISVMMAYDRGDPLDIRSNMDEEWEALDTPSWNWDDFTYRIKPTQPPKTRRYETRKEFMLLVPTHGCFLVRRNYQHDVECTAIICISETFVFYTNRAGTIGAHNFRDYEKSLDGGKSWVDCGVEE